MHKDLNAVICLITCTVCSRTRHIKSHAVEVKVKLSQCLVKQHAMRIWQEWR
jgi:hypothetical protein